uniref:hypothetical protein n=1 Tax=Acetatifactor sp. TaxID=1872090 RepID=UPI004056AC4A
MKKVTYEEKIETICLKMQEYGRIYETAVEEITAWVMCEWRLGMFDTEECTRLEGMVIDIAQKVFSR